MNSKYKGIDLERIKQVQEINFSHIYLIPEMVQLDLKRTFSLDDFKVKDSVMDAVRLQIEAHQNKHREDMEMFIICEMAKLFLEEKEKQKKVLERLEEASYWTPSTYDIDGYCNDDSEEVIDLDKAIEIIKEEVGKC